MAGVDVDTSVLKSVIGMSAHTGRKRLVLRLPTSRLEKVRELDERRLLPQLNLPKYKDHPLVRIVDRTLEGQGMPQEEVCAPWKQVDLKSRKRKKAPEGNSSDGGSSKKKSKSGGHSKSGRHGKSGSESKSGGQPKSSRVSFRFNGKPVKETSTSAGGEASKAPSESGVSRSRTNSLAGPSTSSAPSLESSLLGIHQCLAGIHAGGRADSKTLWKEASKLKEESTKKIKEENAVSKESMSMKVEAGMKYLEAGIHTSNKISEDVMFNTGKLLFTVAEKHGGKVVGDDFTRTCFTALTQRLGVCAHMRYCQQAKKSDVKALSVIQQAVDMAASTTRELADLREKTQLLSSSDNSIIALIESLLRNSGFGPLEQHLYIARRALNMLMERN